MRIFGKGILGEFTKKHNDAQAKIEAWNAETLKSEWEKPQDIIDRYPSAHIVQNKVVFKIKGNHYRLVVNLDYDEKIVMVLFAGTHDEYDDINVVDL
jgi:mRNA interferase HigB